LSRSPNYDTATHPRTDIIIEPSPGFLIPAYEWFNVIPSASINKRGLTETSILGINLSHRTASNWLNNLEAGYTSNSTAELPVQDGSVPLQRQYYSGKDKITTIRYSNVFNLQHSSGFATVISSGAEYKQYSSGYSYTRAIAATTIINKDPDNKNYGAFVQVSPSYKNIYLTMGVRYENNDLFDAAWNPRIGVTTNFSNKYLTFKPKLSWG
jgi:outer membrane cobalamin receptor